MRPIISDSQRAHTDMAQEVRNYLLLAGRMCAVPVPCHLAAPRAEVPCHVLRMCAVSFRWQVLVSRSLLRAESNTMLFVVPGSGSIETGFWNTPGTGHRQCCAARSGLLCVCIVEATTLEEGSLITCVFGAAANGWGTIILNWARNREPNGLQLNGSSTPLEHLLTVWDWAVATLPHVRTAVVIAHSEGGALFMRLLHRRLSSACKLLAGLALVDSVHKPSCVSPAVQGLVRMRAVHWIASTAPLDAPLARLAGGEYCEALSHDQPTVPLAEVLPMECTTRSAGSSQHMLTAPSAMWAVFAWLQACVPPHGYCGSSRGIAVERWQIEEAQRMVIAKLARKQAVDEAVKARLAAQAVLRKAVADEMKNNLDSWAIRHASSSGMADAAGAERKKRCSSEHKMRAEIRGAKQQLETASKSPFNDWLHRNGQQREGKPMIRSHTVVEHRPQSGALTRMLHRGSPKMMHRLNEPNTGILPALTPIACPSLKFHR